MALDKDTSKKIAQILLKTESVKLKPSDPFQWSSGWKSPIYCDNRVTLSFPKERMYIKQKLVELIEENYPQVETIAGVATAGIAQGALIAEAMGLPYLYVRPEPKKHGMKNTVEGRLIDNQKVVLIEDLISTGGSSIKAANNIKEAGADVLGIVATFSYGFSHAEENFKDANIPFEILSDYSFLIDEALENGYVKESDIPTLIEWRKDPENWNK